MDRSLSRRRRDTVRTHTAAPGRNGRMGHLPGSIAASTRSRHRAVAGGCRHCRPRTAAGLSRRTAHCSGGCRLSTSDGVPEVARARRTRLMVRVTQVPVDDRGASVRQCPRGDSLPRHTTPRRPVMNCVHRGRAGGHLGARGGPAADHHLARGARPPSPGRAAAPDLRRVCAATAHGRRPNWCVGAWSWRCASLQVR